MEWKDGRWQKKRVAMESPNNPSLSLLCNLLYNEEPDWLLKVHDNGMAVVNAKDADECAKDHVTQSILDCLPALIVDPSAKSTHAHAILLWTAGQEMQSMQVILRHQMWSQALDFFSSLPEDTNTLVVLFIMMFKAFLCYCAPKEVLLKALSLAPQGFSTYELLFILQDNGPKCNEPFVHDVLTVGDVRQQLQEILKQ
ncbi:hypothetical protein QZH41_017456 [Actinostola sp. cb2023]|nr:hypothetical protein QZH41_017456 [Actinostola sp. cb2023]